MGAVSEGSSPISVGMFRERTQERLPGKARREWGAARRRGHQPSRFLRFLTRALFGQQGCDVAAVCHQARQVQGGEAAPAGGGGAERVGCGEGGGTQDR